MTAKVRTSRRRWWRRRAAAVLAAVAGALVTTTHPAGAAPAAALDPGSYGLSCTSGTEAVGAGTQVTLFHGNAL